MVPTLLEIFTSVNSSRIMYSSGDSCILRVKGDDDSVLSVTEETDEQQRIPLFSRNKVPNRSQNTFIINSEQQTTT